MKTCCFGTSIVNSDADQDVFRSFLGVFEKYIEVPIVSESACLEKFIFEVVTRKLSIRLHKIAVWEFLLRILVKIFHVVMGRRRVQVKVVLLNILAVVSFAVSETEEPL